MAAIQTPQEPLRAALKLFTGDEAGPPPGIAGSTIAYAWMANGSNHPFEITVWTTREWARLPIKPSGAQPLSNGCWMEVRVGW